MRTGQKRNDKCRIKLINKICYLFVSILAIQYSHKKLLYLSAARIVIDMQYNTVPELFGNIHFYTYIEKS